MLSFRHQPGGRAAQWCRISGHGREPAALLCPSTASASEVLTNIAIRDWLAPEDADFYELLFHHHSTSCSSVAPVSDWDSLDFFNPFAREDSDDVYDLDLDSWTWER